MCSKKAEYPRQLRESTHYWRRALMNVLKQMVRIGLPGLPAGCVLLAMFAGPAYAQQATGVPGSSGATTTGDACRREICNSAVAGCMRADLSLNPLASTEREKKGYCDQFFPGCMGRYITPDLPWYSPEMAARFLKCPS